MLDRWGRCTAARLRLTSFRTRPDDVQLARKNEKNEKSLKRAKRAVCACLRREGWCPVACWTSAHLQRSAEEEQVISPASLLFCTSGHFFSNTGSGGTRVSPIKSQSIWWHSCPFVLSLEDPMRKVQSKDRVETRQGSTIDQARNGTKG